MYLAEYYIFDVLGNEVSLSKILFYIFSFLFLYIMYFIIFCLHCIFYIYLE